jgi:hypothetical protein
MMSRAIPAACRYLALACFALWCLSASVWAGSSTSDMLNTLPPVIKDTTRAANCTVTYLVANIVTNDMLAVRMQVSPDPNDRPANDLMPCPPDIPPRVASRALDACVVRSADPKDCVYADMGRDFDKQPKVDNTAENNARCSSDKAAQVGVACWISGNLQVCDVGCGDTAATAVAAAVARCEAKHQRQCPITGSLPVLAPN